MVPLNEVKTDVLRYIPARLLFARSFIKEIRESPLPLLDALKAFSKGFFPNSFIAYNLRNNNWRDYVSDLHRIKSRHINGRRDILLHDKLLFELHMKELVNVPTNYCLVSKGEIIPLDQTGNFTSISGILEYCDKEGYKLVLKPYAGYKGIGVFILSVRENKIRLNNNTISARDFEVFFSRLDSYIVTEYIEQSSYISKVFPDAVNTIRVLTMINPFTHKPFVAMAVQRMGTSKSAPTDNLSCGGLSAFIDLKTGVLGKAAAFPSHSTNRSNITWYDKHPETGNQISGVQIPNWNGAIESILGLARRIPYIPYIGWDLCVYDDKIVVIEGNSVPGVVLFQMHEPLLMNEQVRDFYNYHLNIK